MSVQREFACESQSILSTLSTEYLQPPTPRISHLQFTDPIPELELLSFDDFEPLQEFSIECKLFEENELTTKIEDAEVSLSENGTGRSTYSDLSARLERREGAMGRTRVRSEGLGILASENSIFKFLMSRKLSLHEPKLFP